MLYALLWFYYIYSLACIILQIRGCHILFTYIFWLNEAGNKELFTLIETMVFTLSLYIHEQFHYDMTIHLCKIIDFFYIIRIRNIKIIVNGRIYEINRLERAGVLFGNGKGIGRFIIGRRSNKIRKLTTKPIIKDHFSDGRNIGFSTFE
jgi:hypothetical protein